MKDHTDTHAHQIHESNSEHRGLHIDGTGYSEAIKLSNRNKVTVKESTFIGGNEDCLDIVRGNLIRFETCAFRPGSKTRTLCTIKGGASDVRLVNCFFDTKKKTRWPWHISVGDYTIYDRDKATPPTQVFISQAEYSKRKPIVLVLNGQVQSDGTVRIFKLPTTVVGILFWLNRKFGDKRKPKA